jgi:hypothetical protein
MFQKRYLINGRPVSASELIEEAKFFDSDFGSDGLCTTSGAASILRQHNITVENIPEAQK